MGTARVVIELDSAPSSFSVPTSGDYLERCVVSALFQSALRLVCASNESDYFEFVVEDGQFFSDGSSVRPDDVLRTLIGNAASPLWARHIAYVEKAHIVGDRLCLRMRRPAGFYPDMLGTVDFAPTHPDGLGNGPYKLDKDFDAERGYYSLTPNPFFPQAADRPDLVFRLESDVHGAPERYVRGETDITCSTAFPLDRLPDWRGSDALYQAPTGIYMQVEPNPCAESPFADPSLRRAMTSCLDLAEIADKFCGGLRPVNPVEAASSASVGIPSRIRISYHDFYPNRQVLEHVSLQWRKRLGICVELVERAYSDWRKDDADAAFVLRYLPFNHRYAHFDQCAVLLADATFDQLLERFAAGDDEVQTAMNHIVRARLPMMRMFEVIGNWLARPDVTGFSWPTDAAFDFTSLRCADGRVR